jgi:hypothetical protein
VFFNHFQISFNLNENVVWYSDEEEVSGSESDLNDGRTPPESSRRQLQIREITHEDAVSQDKFNQPMLDESTSDTSDTDSSQVEPKQGTFLEFHQKGFLVLKENLIQTLSIICKNKKAYITRIDFSELYPNMSRQFDVFTEMINGPCSMNQELLIENFNLGDLQVILEIIFRRIRNLDSPFLDLQLKCVVLLLAMIEGGFKPAVDLLVKILEPNEMFKIMTNLVKMLYVKTLYPTKEAAEKWEKTLRKSGKITDKVEETMHFKKSDPLAHTDQLKPKDPDQILRAMLGMAVPQKKVQGIFGSEKDISIDVPKSKFGKDQGEFEKKS